MLSLILIVYGFYMDFFGWFCENCMVVLICLLCEFFIIFGELY